MLRYLWVENFDEIALSRTVKEIEANLCFAIIGQNTKIQNGRHFWGGENFLKIVKITFLMWVFHHTTKAPDFLRVLGGRFEIFA